MITVSNKVVIVTGGAQGIGKDYGLELAKSGANVVLSDISSKVKDTASQIASTGGNCFGIEVDISKEDDTKKMYSAQREPKNFFVAFLPSTILETS